MLDVLFEDNHLLVINKSADIATMGAESGPTLYSLVGEYLKEKYNKPGNVFVGIVSRLDTFTSGVIVVARTSKAASRLTPQFGGGSSAKKAAAERADKVYLAIVEGELHEDSGTLVDHVAKDDAARRMRVREPGGAWAQKAELSYVRIAQLEDAAIVAVKLDTGRKHQIRVQFADRGHCVLGDRKYGSKRPFPTGIALHSWSLQINHPTLKTRLRFDVKPPKSWKQFASFIPNDEELRAINF